MKKILNLCLLIPIAACHASSISIGLLGGGVFPKISNTTAVQITSQQWNNYAASKKMRERWISGARIATSLMHLNAHWTMSLGVIGLYTNLGKFQGKQYPLSNGGSFDPLGYDFRVRSTGLLLSPRFTYQRGAFQPYVQMGLGLAVNRAYAYNEFTIPSSGGSEPVPNGFKSHSRVGLSYLVGAGVATRILHRHRHAIYLGTEYGWVDFGKAKLGKMPPQTAPSRLKINHLGAQYLLLSLEYRYGE